MLHTMFMTIWYPNGERTRDFWCYLTVKGIALEIVNLQLEQEDL